MDNLDNGAALGIILDLNNRFDQAVGAADKSERDKLLVQAGGFIHLLSLGGLAKTGEKDGVPIFEASDAIKRLIAERNIKNKVDAFNHCAQLVLGYVIDTISDKKAKKKARNFTDRCARLFQALLHFQGQDPDLFPATEEKLADWIEENNGLDGVVDRFKKETLGDEAADNDVDADLSEFEEALDANAVTAKLDEPFAPDLTVALIRLNEDGQLRMMALPAVPVSVIAQLAPYLPALDTRMPDEVRFWANVATLCMMFDRQDSSELARPSEGRDNGSKLPSMPIVRIESPGALVVAASRVTAGLVAHITARVDTVLPTDMPWNRHLNGTATKLLIANMAGGASRAAFNGVGYDKNTQKLSFTTRTDRVKPFSVNALPMSAFGQSRHTAQWTIDVRSFQDSALSTIELEHDMLPKSLSAYATKAAASKHGTIVKITKGELTLAQGKEAQPIPIPSKGERSGMATIASADLAKVVVAIEAIGPASVTVSMDSAGLVAFTLEARVANYRLFVPVLLDGGARSPALIKRIERPREATNEGTATEPRPEPETRPERDAEAA